MMMRGGRFHCRDSRNFSMKERKSSRASRLQRRLLVLIALLLLVVALFGSNFYFQLEDVPFVLDHNMDVSASINSNLQQWTSKIKKTSSSTIQERGTASAKPNFLSKPYHHNPAIRSAYRRDDHQRSIPSNSTTSAALHPNDPMLIRGLGWDTSPIVLTRHRLIFQTFPKVATTVLKQLFRRMEGMELWNIVDTDLPHNPQKNGLYYLYDFDYEQVQAWFQDPNWTKAIFIRDPLERALSAYLDKGRRQQGRYILRHCCGIRSFGKNNKLEEEGQPSEMDSHNQHLRQASFKKQQNNGASRRQLLQGDETSQAYLETMQKMVQQRHSQMVEENQRPSGISPGQTIPSICARFSNVTATDQAAHLISWNSFVQDFLGTCQDPHWNPQATFSNFVHFCNFVGHFDLLAQDTERLLQRVGAWETYGSTGWGVDGKSPIFESNLLVQHQTHSQDYLKDYYANQTLRRRVLDYYQADYASTLFQLPKPNF